MRSSLLTIQEFPCDFNLDHENLISNQVNSGTELSLGQELFPVLSGLNRLLIMEFLREIGHTVLVRA